MIKRLRFVSESAARITLQTLGYEDNNGHSIGRISIHHIGAINPSGCAGCLNNPSAEAPPSCPMLNGCSVCPAACWHVDIWGDCIDDSFTLDSEIAVNNPKHTPL